jgi:DNA-binding protein HU-beta
MSDTITKANIIDEVAVAAEIPTSVASVAVNKVFESITTHVASGKSVAIAGFGSFNPVKREARTGRNPATGAAMKIPAKTVCNFKAGKKLKEAVNCK